MRALLFLLVWGSCATPLAAQAGEVWFGGSFGLGGTRSVGSLWDEENVQNANGPDARLTPAFAVALGLDVDIYLVPVLAVTTGFGIVTKGNQITDLSDLDSLVDTVVYLELPVGLKLNLLGFQAGAGIAAYVALSATSTGYYDGDSAEYTWEEDDWEYHRRFNLGPKVTLGYAIEIGKVAIVPSAEFTMHLLSDSLDPTGLVPEDKRQSRYVSILFRMGFYFITG